MQLGTLQEMGTAGVLLLPNDLEGHTKRVRNQVGMSRKQAKNDHPDYPKDGIQRMPSLGRAPWALVIGVEPLVIKT